MTWARGAGIPRARVARLAASFALVPAVVFVAAQQACTLGDVSLGEVGVYVEAGAPPPDDGSDAATMTAPDDAADVTTELPTICSTTWAGGQLSDFPYLNSTTERVVTDASGNIVVLYLSGDASSSGASQFVLMKFDAQCKVVWTQEYPIANMRTTLPLGLATDASSNLYLGGLLGGTITLGNTTLTAPPDSIFLNLNGESALVAKIDPSGNTVWASLFSSTQYGNTLSRLGTDAAGNVYITGTAGSDTDFGGGSIGGQNAGFDEGNGYVVELGPDGSFVYGVPLAGSSSAGLGVNAGGSTRLVSAPFGGDDAFDWGGGSTMVDAGSVDVLAFDPTHEYLWSGVLPGPIPASSSSSNVILSASSDAFVAYGVQDSDDDDGGVTSLASSWSRTVARLSPTGQVLWSDATSFAHEAVADDPSSADYTDSQWTAVDANNDLFVGGSFQGTLATGSAAPLQSAGNFDAYVRVFDPSGHPMGAGRWGGEGIDRLRALTVTASRQPVVFGFSGAPANAQMFLAKLGAP
jgi:hypothetical protein